MGGKYFKLLSIENKPYLKSYESKDGRRANGFPLPLQGNEVFYTKEKGGLKLTLRSSSVVTKVEQSITDDYPNWSKLLHFKNSKARSTWLENLERAGVTV